MNTAPPMPASNETANAVVIGFGAGLARQIRDEIKEAIIFYDGRGWDWLPLVSYLTAKANGEWPK